MSRLFAITKTMGEIITHFRIDLPSAADVPMETIEGTQGLIVFEKDGLRVLKSIPWGFPTKDRDGTVTRIGLVADLTNSLWERTGVDPRYRCLIPLTHFANPDGPKGEKTRTWFSLNRHPLMARAGFCRNTPEFGPVFAGIRVQAQGTLWMSQGYLRARRRRGNSRTSCGEGQLSSRHNSYVTCG